MTADPCRCSIRWLPRSKRVRGFEIKPKALLNRSFLLKEMFPLHSIENLCFDLVSASSPKSQLQEDEGKQPLMTSAAPEPILTSGRRNAQQRSCLGMYISC